MRVRGVLVAASAGVLAATMATPSAQQPGQPTFRSTVEAVTLDVRVVDADGRFVPNLTRDDLKVFEDGVEQSISTFDLVNIPIHPAEPSGASAPDVEADVASNDGPETGGAGRLYVLLMDDLHTNPSRSADVRAQAQAFVERDFTEADRAIVLTTSGRLSTSQQFTSSRARLLDAISHFDGEVGFVEQAQCGANGGSAGACATSEDLSSLHSVTAVANWLAPLAGRRKAVLFFSEGLTLDQASYILGPDPAAAGASGSDSPGDASSGDPTQTPGGVRLSQKMAAGAAAAAVLVPAEKAAEGAATRANVVIYPLDPRQHPEASYARIVNETSSYYLIGYVPTNGKHDGGFRKLDVRGVRPGLKVQARSGYTAKSDAPARASTNDLSPALAELMATPIATSGLAMRVAAPSFTGRAGKDSVEVIVDVAGRDLTAASSASGGRGKLELLITVTGADGRAVASERGSLDMKLSPASREAMASQGLRVLSRLDVPPGKYLLRVAGIDGDGNTRGSLRYDLDVPDFSKNVLTMSGLTLSSASELHQPTTGSDKDWSKRFAQPPTTTRSFRAGDALTVAGEVYSNDANPEQVVVTTSVLRPSGDVVFTGRQSSNGSGKPATYKHQTAIALDDMEAGDYRLRVEARDAANAPVTREVPFSVIAAPAVPAAPATEGQPELQEVLQRAAAYVADFSRKVSGLVAEESYSQDAVGVHRDLKSDFLLVRLPGWDRYVEFRDVFEVDGRPVRDRQDRLTRLFLNPAASQQQIAAIVAESARYNIGRIERTVNVPMLPLQFLTADVQGRFEFKRTTDTRPSRISRGELNATGQVESPHFAVPAGTWAVEYRETGHGTIIRDARGRDVPAYGRFWLEPGTGRVLMSELRTQNLNVAATIIVSYQSEPMLGLSVPVEMREYYDSSNQTGVRGVATYGRFRQFSVQTDEVVAPPAR